MKCPNGQRLSLGTFDVSNCGGYTYCPEHLKQAIIHGLNEVSRDAVEAFLKEVKSGRRSFVNLVTLSGVGTMDMERVVR